MEPVVIIDADRCVGCFMCERACALARCLEVDEVDRIAKVVRPWDCTGCGACERACPYSCIIVLSDPAEVNARAKVTVSRVTRHMRRPVVMCNGNEGLRELAKVMSDRRIASLPFYRKSELHILTESDLLRLYMAGERDISDFENPAVTVTEKETVYDAIRIMSERDIGHLPVLSVKEVVVGMLSIRDCLRGVSVTDLDSSKKGAIPALLPFKGTEPVKEAVKNLKHVTVDEDTTLMDAVRTMCREKVKALIVQGERVGIFTVRDATRMIGEGSREDERIRPREVPVLSADDEMSKAIGIMLQHNLRHLLVTDGNSYYVLQVKELIKDLVWIEKSL